MQRIDSIDGLASLRKQLRSLRDPHQPCIILCGGTGCRANAGLELADAFRRELAGQGLEEKIQLKLSGCHGFCQQGPVVVIEPEGIFYRQVGLQDREEDVRDIIEKTLLGGELVERLLYEDPETGEKVSHYKNITFYAKQMRIALRNDG